jgi:hypothetical protein
LPKRSTAINYFKKNLPIINKTKHPTTKREKMEKTRGLKTRQTKKPSKKANSLGEWGQIKYLEHPLCEKHIR